MMLGRLKILKQSKDYLSKRGAYLPVILLSSVLFIAYAVALSSLAFSNVKITDLHNKKITSLYLAEAGINYYMWHLAHEPLDYCDGVLDDADPDNDSKCPNPSGPGENGPFAHSYYDSDVDDGVREELGAYTLYITPPPPGGTRAQIKSVGQVRGTTPTRTVIAQIGMPSFSEYTFLSNDTRFRLGPGGVIEGSVYANNNNQCITSGGFATWCGFYNEGTITGDTYSVSAQTRNPYSPYNIIEEGIVDPDNGIAGSKNWPVTGVPFEKLKTDLNQFRTLTRDEAKGDYYGESGQQGYHVKLEAAGYRMTTVTGIDSAHLTMTAQDPANIDLAPLIPYPVESPKEGVIFFEDNIWIEGEIDNVHLTVVAADPDLDPTDTGTKRIYIPNNLTYTEPYDGTDKLGLIAQRDIFIVDSVPDSMRLDAAMVATAGEAGAYLDCRGTTFNPAKTSATLYGSRADTGGGMVCGSTGYGFSTRRYIMDPHNVLTPPPHFPKLYDTYQILSWREE